MAAPLRLAARSFGEEGPLAVMAAVPPPGQLGDWPFEIDHDVPQPAPVYHFQPTTADPLLGVLRGDGDVAAEAARLVTPDSQGGLHVLLHVLVHANNQNLHDNTRQSTIPDPDPIGRSLESCIRPRFGS